MPIMTDTIFIHPQRKTKLALSVLLPLSATVYAADPVNSQSTQDILLDEISVTATREKQLDLTIGYQAKTNTTAVKTDTALIDLPQSLTVITPELIKDQNMQSIADTIRYVPGVGISQGEGNRDTPIFRGNSSTSDMYVDGIRDDVQYYRDLYNVERVDVLKGPNAMVFGRGGSGGLINRATKVADWSNTHEMNVQFGSFDKYRLTGDFDHAISQDFAVRLTSMWESSRSYREGFEAGRWGINPTVSWRPSDQTKVTLGYEHYEDNRVGDRGVSSYMGLPVKTSPATFFGDPDRSPTGATVDSFNAVVDHDFGGVTIRNRTRYAIYDKFYQNIFPAAVNRAGDQVAISAYNNATQRENFFNQTDLNFSLYTGAFKHKFLTGMEFGRQETDNFRNTGYFTDVSVNATSANVWLSNPIYKGNVVFRQSATDADNHGVATIVAGYLQDQIELSKHWQAILGLRYDRFEVDFRNNRNGQNFATADDLLSPRGGLIFKPLGDNFSLYTNYSIAYVPRAGEQLGSLSLSTQVLKPEEFRNYEIGAKWDITPEMSTTLAFFQLDRLNALATDPNNPAVSFLVDGQRTRGIELGFSGNITDDWKVIGGYAYQNAEITKNIASGSSTAYAGATLAQVPEHTFSWWNRYDVTQKWGFGLGSVYRSKMYAAVDNAVTLPSFLRFDAAVYYKIDKNIQLQVNIENLLDKQYYASAHSNTNITPGSPIAANAGITMKF